MRKKNEEMKTAHSHKYQYSSLSAACIWLAFYTGILGINECTVIIHFNAIIK